jgi:two-component system chemotaxis sensor kinase CheA
MIFNIETNGKLKLIEQDQVNVIFIERGNRKFSVAVEEFLEQTEIVVKKVEQLVKAAKGISGATILSDGTVSLILDPFTLVTS